MLAVPEDSTSPLLDQKVQGSNYQTIGGATGSSDPAPLDRRVSEVAISTIKGNAQIDPPTGPGMGKKAAVAATIGVGLGKLLTLTWLRDAVRGVFRCCFVKPDREVLLDGYKQAVASNFEEVPRFSCLHVWRFEEALTKLDIFDPDIRMRIDELEQDLGYQYLSKYEPQHPAVQYINDLKEKLGDQQDLGDVRKYQPTRDQEGHGVHRFQYSLRSLNIRSLAQDPAAMRQTIARLSKHPGYQYLLKNNPQHRAVKYLQMLGDKLESADGRDAFRAYGAKRTGLSGEGSCTYSELVTRTHQGRKDGWISHHDNPAAKAAWALSHVSDFDHGLTAHTDPENYDSYKNQTVFMGDTLVEGEGEEERRIHIKFTPGITGKNSIVKDVLIPAYRDQGKRWVFISNQSMHTYDERTRINVVQGWAEAEENKDTFRHVVLSTDVAGQQEFKDILREHTSDGHLQVDAYMDDFEKLVRGTGPDGQINNSRIHHFERAVGFYIPDDLLSNKELNAVFAAAKSMLKDDPRFQTMSPQEAEKVVRRTIISTLSWAVMKKEQMTHQDSILSIACKEMIDRGVMEYMEMLGNDLMFRGTQELPTEHAQFVSGIALGRAHIAKDRPPMIERVEPVVKRAEFVHSPTNRSAFDRGHDALRDLALALRPVPTQPPEVPSVAAVPAPPEGAITTAADAYLAGETDRVGSSQFPVFEDEEVLSRRPTLIEAEIAALLDGGIKQSEATPGLETISRRDLESKHITAAGEMEPPAPQTIEN